MTTNLSNFVRSGKKIVAVAANYNALLALNKLEKPQHPVIFLKPTSSYIEAGEEIIIPKGWMVNEEVELGVVIGCRCKKATMATAMDFVGGYCVALDMTATSELAPARAKGWPWTAGKGFDTATPVSRFIERHEIPEPHVVTLWCDVNGVTKQKGSTSDLTFSVPELICYISSFMTLEPADVILTGTPVGMSAVRDGDVVTAGIAGLVSVEHRVVEEA